MSRSIGEELAELVGKTDEEEIAPDSQPETVEEKEETEESPAPSQEEQKPEEPEKEPKAEEPAVVKEVPFHKHPRWQKLQQELAEAREEAKKAREVAESKQSVKDEPKPMPEAFTKLFGSNDEAWKEWQKLGLMTRDEVTDYMRQMREEDKAQERAVKEANERTIQWAEEQFTALTDETGVDFTEGTERNRVLDIIDKYGLYTPDGRPNIVKANELREALYPKKAEDLQEKKKVVAKTNAKANAGATESDIITPSKLKEMEKRGGVHQFFK